MKIAIALAAAATMLSSPIAIAATKHRHQRVQANDPHIACADSVRLRKTVRRTRRCVGAVTKSWASVLRPGSGCG